MRSLFGCALEVLGVNEDKETKIAALTVIQIRLDKVEKGKVLI